MHGCKPTTVCNAGTSPKVLVATGGDDQALGVIKVALERRCSKQGLLATVQSSTMLDNAHSSAIKVESSYGIEVGNHRCLARVLCASTPVGKVARYQGLPLEPVC